MSGTPEVAPAVVASPDGSVRVPASWVRLALALGLGALLGGGGIGLGGGVLASSDSAVAADLAEHEQVADKRLGLVEAELGDHRYLLCLLVAANDITPPRQCQGR